MPSLSETPRGSSALAVLHSSQLNSVSFTHLMPVEKSVRWVQTKVLKLPPQKVHPESEVRDFVCLMRAEGQTQAQNNKNQSCSQKRTKGQVGQHRGLLPKEGQGFPRSWSAQAKVSGGGRICVSWGNKSIVKVGKKMKRGLGWTKI